MGVQGRGQQEALCPIPLTVLGLQTHAESTGLGTEETHCQ